MDDENPLKPSDMLIHDAMRVWFEETHVNHSFYGGEFEQAMRRLIDFVAERCADNEHSTERAA